MSDATIVAALEALATKDGGTDIEAASILGADSEAEVAAKCVARAKAGQVVALRALGDAGESARLGPA